LKEKELRTRCTIHTAFVIDLSEYWRSMDQFGRAVVIRCYAASPALGKMMHYCMSVPPGTRLTDNPFMEPVTPGMRHK
jgi:hypothetical protein